VVAHPRLFKVFRSLNSAGLFETLIFTGSETSSKGSVEILPCFFIAQTAFILLCQSCQAKPLVSDQHFGSIYACLIVFA